MMKTFETEKGNIPDGATHYLDESISHSFYFAKTDEHEGFLFWSGGMWCVAVDYSLIGGIKPIPQTKEVDWVNGDSVDAYGKVYKYVGLDPFNDNLCICLANPDDHPQCFSIDALKKPETQEDRGKREELEAAYDLYSYVCKESVMTGQAASFEQFNRGMMTSCREEYLTIVRKTGYRKGGE